MYSYKITRIYRSKSVVHRHIWYASIPKIANKYFTWASLNLSMLNVHQILKSNIPKWYIRTWQHCAICKCCTYSIANNYSHAHLVTSGIISTRSYICQENTQQMYACMFKCMTETGLPRLPAYLILNDYTIMLEISLIDNTL